MQKIQMFHMFRMFIRQIQSALEYVTRLKIHIFDHTHSKNFQSLFNLREFVPASKKSVDSICSFL